MPREFSVNKKKKHLFLRVFGSVSRDAVEKAFQRVKQLCQENNLHRVLIDHHAVEALPNTPELFNLAQLFVESMNRKIHFAVIQASGKILEDERFFETVIHNRGGQFRLFTDRADAEAWLNEI
jgi:hypothetical protein